MNFILAGVLRTPAKIKFIPLIGNACFFTVLVLPDWNSLHAPKNQNIIKKLEKTILL